MMLFDLAPDAVLSLDAFALAVAELHLAHGILDVADIQAHLVAHLGELFLLQTRADALLELPLVEEHGTEGAEREGRRGSGRGKGRDGSVGRLGLGFFGRGGARRGSGAGGNRTGSGDSRAHLLNPELTV